MSTQTVLAGWSLVGLSVASLLIALAVAVIRNATRRTADDMDAHWATVPRDGVADVAWIGGER